MTDSTWRIEQGHVLDVLAAMPAESVHCAVTSPPYYALRSYGIAPQMWPDGWLGELGAEPSVEMYVEHIVTVLAVVRRVLRPDGTLWLNIGDSYNTRSYQRAGGNREVIRGFADERLAGWSESKNKGRVRYSSGQKPLKDKDLMLVPERLALALQADGWYVRSRIAWCKLASMPEPARDRPTTAWDHIWLLARSARYYYDAVALRDDANLRNYWLLPPAPFPGAHFATFPPELPRRCILAGTSSRGCCPECGAPWRRQVQYRRGVHGSWHDHSNDQTQGAGQGTSQRGRVYRELWQPPETLGWEAGCRCAAGEPVPCTVLDPFAGAGTTLLAALREGRSAIGIELNPEYVEMARRRIVDDAPLFNTEAL